MKVSDGGLARAGVDDIHALTVDRVASDLVENALVSFDRGGFGDGEVVFSGETLGKLGDERLMGDIIFCDHNTPGGVFIEAVDDAGALDPADAGKLALAVVEEGVD